MASTDSRLAIRPLYLNGLSGRVAHVQASAGKTAALLVVACAPQPLEAYAELLTYLSRFGNVTMPEMPGLGGMQPFRAIGQRPSLDAFAAYLAACMTLYFRRSPVTIVTLGFGFATVTRMLQCYPAFVPHVRSVVSIGGWAHNADVLRAPGGISSGHFARMLGLPFQVSLQQRSFDTPLPRLLSMDQESLPVSDRHTCAALLREARKLNLCALAPVETTLWVVPLTEDMNQAACETHIRLAYHPVHIFPASVSNIREAMRRVPPSLFPARLIKVLNTR